MNYRHSLLIGRIGTVLLASLLVGCGGDSVTNPRFQPEISNQTDNFQFQATNTRNVTQTVEYTWANTGVQANVNQATTLTKGSATLVLRDPDGTQVYSRSLTENGTFVSNAGKTGNWKIRVVISNADGTFNFRVQKKT